MSNELYASLSRSKWNCKYHVVLVPKRRRKKLFGQVRREIGPILHALARQKECRIIEGHAMADQVHLCLEIPPKFAVASVIGFLKGKSAIAIARKLCGVERNFRGHKFWARGYAVSTVGFELNQVRAYIRNQEVSEAGRLARCAKAEYLARGTQREKPPADRARLPDA